MHSAQTCMSEAASERALMLHRFVSESRCMVGAEMHGGGKIGMPEK